MNRAGRWATSGLALFLVTFAIYQVDIVDVTDNDPALAPMTAASIVHHGDMDLDEYPLRLLVGRPLVITGRPVRGADPGQVFDDVATLRRAIAEAGPGAHVYDYFPAVPALFAVPAVVAADTVAAVTGRDDAVELLRSGDFARYHVAVSGAIVALAAVVARLLALGLLSGSVRRRRWLATGAALAFAFGTTAWSVASRALWQHGPSLLFAMTALWLVVRLDPFRTTTYDPTHDPTDDDPTDDPTRDDRPARPGAAAAALGACLVAATAARPSNLALVLAVGVWLLVRRRGVAAWAAVGGLAVAAALAAVTLATSAPFPPPYYAGSRVHVTSTTAEAIAANWASPSRGLLWASPFLVVLGVAGAVLLWRDRARRPLVVALGSAVVLMTLSVSAFDRWWAGHTFGPRFMTEAVPPLFLLALPALDAVVPGAADGAPWATTPRRTRVALGVVVALLVWSVGFNALGALSRQTSCWNTTPANLDDDPGRVWSITDSQVGRSISTLVDDGPRRMILGPC